MIPHLKKNVLKKPEIYYIDSIIWNIVKFREDASPDKVDDGIDFNPIQLSQVLQNTQIKWTLHETKEDWLRIELRFNLWIKVVIIIEISSDIYLKMRLLIDARVEDCVEYLTENCSWMKNVFLLYVKDW